MHRRVYDSLKVKPKLFRRMVNLQSANGISLKVYGCINVTLSVGGTEMSQEFYVVKDLNRNLILDLYWLKQNRLYRHCQNAD